MVTEPSQSCPPQAPAVPGAHRPQLPHLGQRKEPRASSPNTPSLPASPTPAVLSPRIPLTALFCFCLKRCLVAIYNARPVGPECLTPSGSCQGPLTSVQVGSDDHLSSSLPRGTTVPPNTAPSSTITARVLWLTTMGKATTCESAEAGFLAQCEFLFGSHHPSWQRPNLAVLSESSSW